MKRILIANDLLKGGGVENVLENLVRYLLRQGDEITLLIPNCSEQETIDLFGNRIKIYPSVRLLKYVKKYSMYWFLDRGVYILQKQLQRVRLSLMMYDVVIALKEGPTMQELAGIYAKKKYAWIHTDFHLMHWTAGYFKSNDEERKCMQRFDNVVCVSQAAANSVIATIGNPGNLIVRYNPIDVGRVARLASWPCLQKKVDDKFLFVSAGRLAQEKNYSLLLDVCAALEKKYNFELWILGEGPDRENLEEKMQRLSLSSVKLLGNQNNPYPYIKAADAFISASICESYGLTIQEALILGVPVIATECAAIKEVFDTRFGQLVNNSVSALYDAMESVIKNPDLGKKYRQNIEKHYSTDNLYEKRLQDICGLWE